MEQADLLESILSFQELQLALKWTWCGIPFGALLKYSDAHFPIHLEVLNPSFEKGALPAFMQEAPIMLYSKSDKDTLHMGSYLAILLITFDYKL